MNNNQNGKPKLNICKIQNATGLLNQKYKIPYQNCSLLRNSSMVWYDEFVKGEDGAKIGKYVCLRCRTCIWFCEEYENLCNLHTDKTGANRYKYPNHLRNNSTNEIINIKDNKEYN